MKGLLAGFLGFVMAMVTLAICSPNANAAGFTGYLVDMTYKTDYIECVYCL